MKKRTTLLITSLVVAFSLLAVTVYANVNSYEGYEAFKEFMQSSHNGESLEEMHSGSMAGSVVFIQDGEKLLTVSGTLQGDGVRKAASGNLILDQAGVIRNLSLYAEDKTFYLFDEENGEYYQMIHSEEQDYEDWENEDFDSSDWEGRNEKMTAAQEELMDFLAGDLKDDFEVTYESNGNQTILFELTEEEMPMVLNLMISAGNSMKDFRQEQEDADFEANKAALEEKLAIYPLFAQLATMDDAVASIEEDFALHLIRMSVTVDENQEPQSMSFAIQISGNDEQGNYHTQEVQAEFAIDQGSDVEITAPDLEGKNIILLDEELFEGFECSEGYSNGFHGSMEMKKGRR